MKNRGIEGRTRRAAVLAPFLLCSVLAGCSTGGEGMLLLVDPAKYQYHTCEQLATAALGAAPSRFRALQHQQAFGMAVTHASRAQCARS
jgi:hypothetical protein